MHYSRCPVDAIGAIHVDALSKCDIESQCMSLKSRCDDDIDGIDGAMCSHQLEARLAFESRRGGEDLGGKRPQAQKRPTTPVLKHQQEQVQEQEQHQHQYQHQHQHQHRHHQI